MEHDIGCCEMETGTWACSTTDTLTDTFVNDGNGIVLRNVCEACAATYGSGT